MAQSQEAARRLFESQKATLDTLLAHGAIERAQYEKSLSVLREKLGIPDEKKEA